LWVLRRVGCLDQHVPPGTQENYNSFSSENSITEKAKEIIQPEGPGGGIGGFP
jgi:hypothetical protein